MPQIGAHVSAALSLDLSLDRAKEIGAECTQIFISPPRQWTKTAHSKKEIATYINKVGRTGIEPNFIHGTYLINLASPNPAQLQQSIDWLNYAQDMASKLNLKGTIFHLGSHQGRGFDKVFDQVCQSLTTILKSSNRPYLILENSAGMGGSVGSIVELGQILRKVNHPNLKVCLDTQHAFAAGFDLRTNHKLTQTVKKLNQEIGWKNLVAVHANDSKVPLGSKKDRHANIGEGFIGKVGFTNLLNHPNFKNLPFILEVPRFSDNGPDKDNIDILRSLMSTID